MNIKPSRNAKGKDGLASWKVFDNKNKVVGTFSARDETREREMNLVAQAWIRDLRNDLHDLKIKIRDLTAGKEWQITDRASQAAMHIQDAFEELGEIIHHIKKGDKLRELLAKVEGEK